MNNLWNDKEASEYKTDLALRVYTSRLLGRNPSLVLHGGGNTSVKITEKNILGEDEEILYIKGSGWDLATIEEPGFSPVKLNDMVKLSALEKLSDPQMVNELKTSMTNYSSPSPSVETILHAIIPFKYVDHTHADALVTVTNTPNGFDFIKEIYGDSVIYIPYVMPGFDLARLCGVEFAKQKNENTIGMALMNHGMFSFGDNAKESYDRMIDLIERSEKFIESKSSWSLEWSEKAATVPDEKIASLSALRKSISDSAGFPLIISAETTDKTRTFAANKDLATISQQGPATPDHIIRTKRLPALFDSVGNYAGEYAKYFETYEKNSTDELTMLDPAPRVILDKDFGLLAAGKSAKDANIIKDIYNHTIEIILRSEKLGGYRALEAKDLFQMEYWDLEQAKLRKGGKAARFQGEVVLVTGAASGIGRACVEKFLADGACVVGLDINTEIETMFDRADYAGFVCDITDENSIDTAISNSLLKFGGIDMIVLNAGIFPKSSKIEDMNLETWKKVMDINLDSNVRLLSKTFPHLKNAPKSGRVVIIGSKNVKAPGPGASAYSASKAALNQLARIAALEWGEHGIRINSIHPNAVFDTGIWTEEVLAARAKSYGLTVEEYKTNNVLKIGVFSRDVANMAAEMCSDTFAKTTGDGVAVDGGNERVI
ncbi:MAG: bifunctional aldolase/short-chain dehydrogenase [Leptospirales bacterium]